MNQFPIEIIAHIFQYLSKKEQIKVSEVNKKFRDALFSPSLWTEYEDIMEVLASQLESFNEFLKQTPWLKYLNLQVSDSVNKPRSFVNLTSVFKPLINLECLVLQLNDCLIEKISFPCTLKHISIIVKKEEVAFGKRYKYNEPTNIPNILYGIADSCPQLEHIQIKILDAELFGHGGLRYLLEKSNRSLKTLILSDPISDANFPFLDCPPNLTTLCLAAGIHYNMNWSGPHLENLQILSFCNVADMNGKYFSNIFVNCSLKNLKFLFLGDFFPFRYTELLAKFTKLPNLQILYLKECHAMPNDIDCMMRFVRGCCPSLKELAWDEDTGYLKKALALAELEKLKKDIPVKIYLRFTGETNVPYNISPSFPNRNFERIETFNYKKLFDIHCENSPNFFKCHSHLIKNILSLR